MLNGGQLIQGSTALRICVL